MQTKEIKKSPNAFRTISEVAEELNVEQHVLRFWETRFSQIKPLKRGGGRRYYRPEDVKVLQHIHHLLYGEGYTIKGAQKVLKGQTRNMIAEVANTNTGPIQSVPAVQQSSTESATEGLTEKQKALLKATLGTLKEMRSLITKAS